MAIHIITAAVGSQMTTQMDVRGLQLSQLTVGIYHIRTKTQMFRDQKVLPTHLPTAFKTNSISGVSRPPSLVYV